MLVGLHTCGDLCSNLLRLFCSSDVMKSMCCVGCCYHHITEAERMQQFNMYVRIHFAIQLLNRMTDFRSVLFYKNAIAG